MINRIWKEHIEWILGAGGLIIAAALLACVIWSLTAVSSALGSAVTSKPDSEAQIRFNLDEAAKLNLRGLK